MHGRSTGRSQGQRSLMKVQLDTPGGCMQRENGIQFPVWFPSEKERGMYHFEVLFFFPWSVKMHARQFPDS